MRIEKTTKRVTTKRYVDVSEEISIELHHCEIEGCGSKPFESRKDWIDHHARHHSVKDSFEQELYYFPQEFLRFESEEDFRIYMEKLGEVGTFQGPGWYYYEYDADYARVKPVSEVREELRNLRDFLVSLDLGSSE